ERRGESQPEHLVDDGIRRLAPEREDGDAAERPDLRLTVRTYVLERDVTERDAACGPERGRQRPERGAPRGLVLLVCRRWRQLDLVQRKAQRRRLLVQQRPAHAMRAYAIVRGGDGRDQPRDSNSGIRAQSMKRQCAVLPAAPAQQHPRRTVRLPVLWFIAGHSKALREPKGQELPPFGLEPCPPVHGLGSSVVPLDLEVDGAHVEVEGDGSESLERGGCDTPAAVRRPNIEVVDERRATAGLHAERTCEHEVAGGSRFVHDHERLAVVRCRQELREPPTRTHRIERVRGLAVELLHHRHEQLDVRAGRRHEPGHVRATFHHRDSSCDPPLCYRQPSTYSMLVLPAWMCTTRSSASIASRMPRPPPDEAVSLQAVTYVAGLGQYACGSVVARDAYTSSTREPGSPTRIPSAVRMPVFRLSELRVRVPLSTMTRSPSGA